MKKAVISIILFLIAGISGFTQVGINSDNTPPANSAMLDVQSTAKGLLIPRMTTAERDAILSPASYLMILNTTTRCFEAYNSNMATWESIHCFECSLPASPLNGSHLPSVYQIIWNWLEVPRATGYKWNTVNNYETAMDMGTATTMTETNMMCNTPYWRFAWAYNECGHSDATMLMMATTLNPMPFVSISASANPVCAGNSVTFTATPANGGTSPVYQWKKNGAIVEGATNSTYIYTPENGDVISCQLTSNATCISSNPTASNAIAMTVNNAPFPASPISGIASWCYGSTFIPETGYSIAPISNATSYVWSVPFGTVIISGLGTNGIVTNAPPGMGLFSVYGTNQCGSGSPSYLFVNMYSPPNPSITGPADVCQHSVGNTYTTESGMSNYHWIISQGGTITSGGTTTSNSVCVTWNTAGAKTIRVNYTNANGCSASSPAVLNITVNPVPATPLTGTQTASLNQIIWNWNTVTGASGYKWNITNDTASAIDMGTVTTKTETGLNCNMAYSRYAWAYNSCGNSTGVTLTATTLACSSFSCGQNITVNHFAGSVAPLNKTTTYGTTTNIPGEMSKCWITSNLGSDHQATAVNDSTEASAGWYWQFK